MAMATVQPRKTIVAQVSKLNAWFDGISVFASVRESIDRQFLMAALESVG
jgi:hypothetical protein